MKGGTSDEWMNHKAGLLKMSRAGTGTGTRGTRGGKRRRRRMETKGFRQTWWS